MVDQCEHTYVFLRSTKSVQDGHFNSDFRRVDTFYCTKCLEQREVKKTACQRDTPDWFRGD